MAVTDKQVLQWFQDNPNATDAQIAQAAAAAGVSASQLSRVTGVPVSEVVSRVEATGSTIQPNDYAAVDSPKSLAEQILSQGTTDKWSGEGFGSAEKNAADMAKILEGIGITDISQFGQFETTVNKQQTVKPEYEYVVDSWDSGHNKPTGRYYIPQYGSDGEVIGKTYVDPASVTKKELVNGDISETIYTANVPTTETVYGNKVTGQAVPNTYSERQTGNAWGGTFAGSGNTGYRVEFAPDGTPVFYTTGASSSDLDSVMPFIQLGLMATGAGGLLGGALNSGLGLGLGSAAQGALGGALLGGGTAALGGGKVLQGAFLGGLGGYAQGGGFSSGADMGLNSNLTMAQIESGLGTPGYGYGAQAASSGLFNPAVIGSGAYTQTSYPYDMADFLAADALQLQGQVGNNLPAIEQNLTASGVDPLVAADVANQVALNPGISQYDLTNYINTTFGGGNIYDVNMATQYPTSQLPGAGGLLSDLPGAGTTTTTGGTTTTTGGGTSSGTGLTGTQIANLIRGGLALAGAGSAVSNMGGGGGGGVGGLPTQGVPIGNQDYYNAIQQYYNAYMPAAPRDVATPLQNWYNSKYGA